MRPPRRGWHARQALHRAQRRLGQAVGRGRPTASAGGTLRSRRSSPLSMDGTSLRDLAEHSYSMRSTPAQGPPDDDQAPPGATWCGWSMMMIFPLFPFCERLAEVHKRRQGQGHVTERDATRLRKATHGMSKTTHKRYALSGLIPLTAVIALAGFGGSSSARTSASVKEQRGRASRPRRPPGTRLASRQPTRPSRSTRTPVAPGSSSPTTGYARRLRNVFLGLKANTTRIAGAGSQPEGSPDVDLHIRAGGRRTACASAMAPRSTPPPPASASQG